MLVKPYVGKHVSAQSASNYIDIETIYAGCTKLENEANSYNDIYEKVNVLGDNNGKDVLEVDGKTISNVVGEYSNVLNDTSNGLIDFANSVRAAAENAYNEIQNQLNENARIEDVNYDSNVS